MRGGIVENALICSSSRKLKNKNTALEKYVAILSKGTNLWVAVLTIRNSCAQFEVVWYHLGNLGKHIISKRQSKITQNTL